MTTLWWLQRIIQGIILHPLETSIVIIIIGTILDQRMDIAAVPRVMPCMAKHFS